MTFTTHTPRIRQQRDAPDQYQLLKDDVKLIDSTPVAKAAIREPGCTSDASLDEMTKLVQKSELEAQT